MSADTVTSSSPKASPLPDGMAEDMTALKQAGDSLNHVTDECMAIYSDGMNGAVKSGALAVNLTRELSQIWMDSLSCTATNMAETGREFLTCRTPADFAIAQKKVIEGMVETMTAANERYGKLYASFGKTIDPLIARPADGPERLFGVLAD